MKTSFQPMHVFLLVAFLLYSVDTVYNYPVSNSNSGSFHGCSRAELEHGRNNAEILDDALYIAGKFLVVDILNRKTKSQELLFYEDLERVAEVAVSAELSCDGSWQAKAFREILTGLVRDACTWVTSREDEDEEEEEEEESEGSGFVESSLVAVNCSNVTDILRFARERELEHITNTINSTNIGTEAVTLALRLQPRLTKMLGYMRTSTDPVPGSRAERQGWVVKNLSPRTRCHVCQSI